MHPSPKTTPPSAHDVSVHSLLFLKRGHLTVYIADVNSQTELKIFSQLPLYESRNVLQLLDNFSVRGPNGLHTILVHDVLGRPTTVMRSPARSGHKVLCRHIAQGLAALHSHGVVHGGKWNL